MSDLTIILLGLGGVLLFWGGYFLGKQHKEFEMEEKEEL